MVAYFLKKKQLQNSMGHFAHMYQVTVQQEVTFFESVIFAVPLWNMLDLN